MRFISLLLIIYLSFITNIYSQKAGEKLFVNQEYSVKGKASEKNDDFIEVVYPGDMVELIFLEENLMSTSPEDDYWAKIKINNKKEGYLPFKLLQKTMTKELTELQKKPRVKKRAVSKTYYVTASSLYVRDEPNKNGNIITSLYKGGDVTVTKYSDNDDYIDGKSSKWAYIDSGDNSGWVFGGYLSEDSGGSEDETPEDPKHIYSGSSKFVKATVLHLRDEPSKFGIVVGTIPKGESVKIKEKNEKSLESIVGVKSIWVRVENDEASGWVFGAFLSDKKNAKAISDSMDKPFQYPLDPDPSASRITSDFGPRIDPVTGVQNANHTGLDLFPYARFGSPIYAAGDGEVIHTSTNTGYGWLTVIRHDNGLVTYYCHQQKFLVKMSDKVKAGDQIGEVGTTGKSTGPHLHFEVRSGLWGDVFNPKNYIPIPSN